MIDTHNHLLPGIDDGARDMEETLSMCRVALDDGIGVIAATPHSFDGKFRNDVDSIKSLVLKLNARLSSADLDLRIVPGMEVRIVADLVELVADGKILPLNEGKYILLEFHPSQLPAGFENLARHLASSGFGLILGHPEKNSVIQGAPEYLFHLLNKFKPWDILIQVSADALTGEHGFRAARTAKTLFRHNLVHIIATDAHSSDKRAPRLSEAVEVASSLIGRESALKMVHEIPKAVLEGGAFPEPQVPKNPRRWWRIF
ncbi:MAG: CpsB/CapC family capsule biosynthesis tyrosine phosphatase [Desulfomonilaceae bacterium]